MTVTPSQRAHIALSPAPQARSPAQEASVEQALTQRRLALLRQLAATFSRTVARLRHVDIYA